MDRELAISSYVGLVTLIKDFEQSKSTGREKIFKKVKIIIDNMGPRLKL